jgi:putative ABC transport system permease protein
MSYSVVQRTREIGIRVALGANPGAVLRMVVGRAPSRGRRGGGLLGALALTRLLESLLFGVSATDSLTFVGVAALLTSRTCATEAVIARLAQLLPVRADVGSALRGERRRRRNPTATDRSARGRTP